MKADKDDAPTYVRPSRRKSNALTWVAASLLGSAVTIGLLYTLGSLYTQGKVDRLANNPKPKPAPVAEITRSAPAEKDWDKIVEDVARRSNEVGQDQTHREQKQPAKQTEYSTATYIPAHAVNLIPAARPAPKQAQMQQPRKQQEIIVVGKETRIKDYCPFKSGSLEQRNCKMRADLKSRN
ncbi:hypothetical protein HP436_14315 [Pseudomonas sp. CrR14]|nr:hypothetical protein [Pseudomonas sp. CrR14]